MSAINNSFEGVHPPKYLFDKHIKLEGEDKKTYRLYKKEISQYLQKSTPIKELNDYLNSVNLKRIILSDSPLSQKIITLIQKTLFAENKEHFYQSLQSCFDKPYETHLLLTLYHDQKLAGSLEQHEVAEQEFFFERTFTRLIQKYTSIEDLIRELIAYNYPVIAPIRARILITKILANRAPEELSKLVLVLFGEIEIVTNPEIEALLTALKEKLTPDSLSYFNKILQYLESFKRQTPHIKDTSVLRCIGTEPGTENDWIFRLETGLDNTLNETRAMLMWQGSKDLDGELEKLFPATLFEEALETPDEAFLLGFSLDMGPSGTFFTFPSPEAIQERWNQLPEEKKRTIRIPKAVSSQGILSPEVFSRYFQDRVIVVSVDAEYAHDMSTHYLKEFIAMNSVPEETYNQAVDHGIQMHRSWEQMVVWAEKGGIELSEMFQTYLRCLNLLNSIYADLFSGESVTKKWDIARNHRLGEDIFTIMNNPDWRKYGREVFKDIDAQEVYQFFCLLKEKYREAETLS